MNPQSTLKETSDHGVPPPPTQDLALILELIAVLKVHAQTELLLVNCCFSMYLTPTCTRKNPTPSTFYGHSISHKPIIDFILNTFRSINTFFGRIINFGLIIQDKAIYVCFKCSENTMLSEKICLCAKKQ